MLAKYEYEMRMSEGLSEGDIGNYLSMLGSLKFANICNGICSKKVQVATGVGDGNMDIRLSHPKQS